MKSELQTSGSSARTAGAAVSANAQAGGGRLGFGSGCCVAVLADDDRPYHRLHVVIDDLGLDFHWDSFFSMFEG